MIAKLIFNTETVYILPTSPDGSGILWLGREAAERSGADGVAKTKIQRTAGKSSYK